jgi:hypothetical protein
MKFKTWSYRFAEQVLNSKLHLRKEIEQIIESIDISPNELSRPNVNKMFREKFLQLGWEEQPKVAEEDIAAKLDFFKERVGVEVAFSHSSFLGIDLLKFQTMSYSNLDKIDIGVYIAVTNSFLKKLVKEYKQKWEGSLTFEKIVKYLPHFKSAIQVPIFVVGLED